jgi:uncharacterized membrane protein
LPRRARRDAIIELIPQVGDFVARGDALFRVLAGREPLTRSGYATHIALGAERTMEQDPTFPFRIIVDVAAKALSPAINDPTTAVLALDQLHHLLRNVGMRRLDTGLIRDRDGRAMVHLSDARWEAFVELALTEIRQFGASSIQVPRRMRALLVDLIAALPPERHPPLRTELRLLQRSLEQAFNDPEDRARAERADSQGIGGQAPDPESGAANG